MTRCLASAGAVEVMEREPAGSWVLIAEARYLPHGGSDWIALALRPEGGGFIERRRTRERRPPLQVDVALSAEASQSIRAELVARGVWQLRDELEPAMDGLRATISFGVDGSVWSANLQGRGRSAGLAELLRFVADLAPLGEE